MEDRCKRSRKETMIEGTIVAVSSDAHSQFSKPDRLSVELVAGVEVKGDASPRTNVGTKRRGLIAA